MDVLEYYIDLKCLPEYQQAYEIRISKQEIANFILLFQKCALYITKMGTGRVYWLAGTTRKG